MHDALPDSVRLEDRACPLGCAAGDRFVVEGRDRLYGLPGRFRVVRCRHCGLLRTNPRPAPESMAFYYPAHYGPHQQEGPAPAAPRPRGWKAGLHGRLGLDARRLPAVAPGSLLEVGCAAGDWLQAMQAQGWTVEGLEFSATAAEAARARGLKVRTGTVEEVATEQRFDVIAAWMVLEHLHDPVGALRRLRGCVQPHGWLVGAVPDAGAWERRLFGSRWYGWHLPHHLYHYDRRTLARVLAAGGWRLERLRWQRNPNNLLHALEELARDRARWVLPAIQWLAQHPRAGRLRAVLGLLLGLSRQSGRMEFWARPLPEAGEGSA